jgi:hypothetical protein
VIRRLDLIAVGGIVIAVAVPLTRYVQKQRDEGAAIEVLQHVRGAQERFRAVNGGYATDMASLVESCGSAPAALDRRHLTHLDSVGFTIELRAAAGVIADLARRDCHGRAVASDYYVAAAPVDSSQAAQEAFAARAVGDIFLFYDGIAPREADMASGLATPLAERARFRIP